MVIEISKKYRTRSGRAVRILCTDGPGRKPVIGYWLGEDSHIEEWHIEEWHIDGSYFYSEKESSLDLIEIAPYTDIAIDTPGWVRVGREGWEPRHFAGVSEQGKPKAWSSGTTSHTSRGYFGVWSEFTTTKPKEGA
jgi:hypothetical protein